MKTEQAKSGSVFEAQRAERREAYKQLMDRYEALEDKYGEKNAEKAVKDLAEEVDSW